MKDKKAFYITTPIYYPSASFHIGHCYTTIIADALARFRRLKGDDVFFLTGTDEHGQKIEKKALEASKTPQAYVDEIVGDAKDLWKSLGISYDKFIRTTDQYHVEGVQKIFQKLYDQDDIYLGEYKGLYCTPCESFWTESQLIDGNCPDCGRAVEEVTEEAYFFRLSNYQDKLVKYYNEHPGFIEPSSRKNEMIHNFIEPGLEDLCVSRTSFKWGIPVPFNENHVVYVWLDALANYLTALGYMSDDDHLFQKFFPANLHLVGKEIVRFHTIIWPAILMALDLPLPDKVFGHGWLIVDGGKISKSKGNYKDPREYINSYGVDAVRYYALREVPFGSDGAFDEKNLVSRINGDLANNLGNLLNRTCSMADKYFNGKITNKKANEEIDIPFINEINEIDTKVTKYMDELHISDALIAIFDLLRNSNKYIDVTAPWILAKDEDAKDRLETVLYNLLESLRVAGKLLSPFLINAATQIQEQIGNKDDTLQFVEDNIYEIGKIIPLFMRIDV